MCLKLCWELERRERTQPVPNVGEADTLTLIVVRAVIGRELFHIWYWDIAVSINDSPRG